MKKPNIRNFTEQQMIEAYARSGGKCEICQSPYAVPMRDLQFHHRKPKSVMTKAEAEQQQSESAPVNCAVLCYKHHTDVHAHRDKYPGFMLHSWEPIEEI
jgi:5-methylcytosine-specific restriction endonuclease McrA